MKAPPSASKEAQLLPSLQLRRMRPSASLMAPGLMRRSLDEFRRFAKIGMWSKDDPPLDNWHVLTSTSHSDPARRSYHP